MKDENMDAGLTAGMVRRNGRPGLERPITNDPMAPDNSHRATIAAVVAAAREEVEYDRPLNLRTVHPSADLEPWQMRRRFG